MPVLDTNILIRLSTEDSAATDALERIAPERPVVPAQVAVEFLTGIDDVPQGLDWLEQAFTVAHTDRDTVILAAQMRAAQIRKKHRPRTADLWIGAHALRLGTYVVTTNKRHFRALDVPAWHYDKEPDPPA